MLTMHPRFASMVQTDSSSTFSSCCILDESEWIGMSVIPRFIPNAHEWPRLHLPHLKNEPGAATVELRFRPRPQSTTIQPECFKRFKTDVACRGGSLITKMLLELLQYYYDSRRCLYGAATNHTDESRFDKSGVNLSSRWAKIVNV